MMKQTMLAAAVLAVWSSPTWASPSMPCHNAVEIAKQLSSKYDEAPVAFGVQSNGNLLQVYASEDKGTWTVVSTTPAGVSCIVAAGRAWEDIPFEREEPMAALPTGVILAHEVTTPDGEAVDYSDLEINRAGETIDCCSDQHCRPVDHRWNAETQRMEIFVRDSWLPVDRSVVVRGMGPPPDGGYHACWLVTETTPRCIWEPSHGS